MRFAPELVEWLEANGIEDAWNRLPMWAPITLREDDEGPTYIAFEIIPDAGQPLIHIDQYLSLPRSVECVVPPNEIVKAILVSHAAQLAERDAVRVATLAAEQVGRDFANAEARAERYKRALQEVMSFAGDGRSDDPDTLRAIMDVAADVLIGGASDDRKKLADAQAQAERYRLALASIRAILNSRQQMDADTLDKVIRHCVEEYLRTPPTSR